MTNNKQYLMFLIVLLLSLGVSMVYAAPKKYKYHIAVGASIKYDMVFDFDKNYLTDKNKQPLLPFAIVGGSPNTPWAQGRQATALSEKNPLPYGIHVRWFSVAENQFYQATHTFDQKMLQRLRTYRVNNVMYRSNKLFSDYMRFIIYVVPGGLVTVWIGAEGDRYLLAQFQAEKTAEPDWAHFSRAVLQRRQAISREDYIKERLNDKDFPILAETRKELATGKIPDARPWLRLSNSYPWQLAVNKEFVLKDYFTFYVNGEQYYTYDQEPQPPKTRPVPYRLSYYVENKTNQNKLERLNLYLNKEETMQAFEKLQAQGLSSDEIKLYLNIKPDLKGFEVYVMKGSVSIELKKVKGQLDNLYMR